MDIDFCIENISDDKLIGGGTNKKCYDFGEFVLLVQRCSDDWLEQEIANIESVKNKLDGINVNAFKILDYKVKGNCVYMLETKLIGEAIQEYNYHRRYNISSLEEAEEEYSKSRKHLEKYIKRLSQLDNYELLEKFFLDYVSIINAGILVDPSKTNNFLFDGSKIWFLDLNCYSNGGTYGVNEAVYYIMFLVCWCQSNDASVDEINDISFHLQSIYSKLMDISKKHGYDIGETYFQKNASDAISDRLSYFFKYSKSYDDYVSKFKDNTK